MRDISSEYQAELARDNFLTTVSNELRTPLTAVLDGNILRVLLLFYLAPVWATFLGVYFLGERLTQRSWLVLAVAMAGALTMLWSPEMGWPWPRDGADWLAGRRHLAT